MRIFLIGFMGCGKSYNGTRLAKVLNMPFVDLDNYIEEKAGKTIAEIFSEQGEEHFRKLEQQALHQMTAFDNIVISCGGGTPCFFDNMEWMNENGDTVYLKCTPQTLEKRLVKGKAKRPLIKDLDEQNELINFIKSKLEKREPFYSKAKTIFNTESEQYEPWIILGHKIS